MLCCAVLCLGYMLDDNMHSYIYKKAHNTQVIAGDPEINPQFVAFVLTAAVTLLSHNKWEKVLIEHFFSRFPPFFFQRKQESRKNIQTFGNLTAGKISGTLSIPIFGTRKETLEIKQKCAILCLEI